MQFLAPLFLWATAAAAVPVIIHLVNRRKPRTVVFPSLRLLREVIEPRRKAAKVREWLVLLLRVLAILLIAFAFSRPAITGGTGWGPGRASVSAVILVDCSASMQAAGPAGPGYATAKRRASEVLAMMRGGDEVAVVGFHNALTDEPIVLTSNIESAQRRIETLHATDRSTDVGNALATAARILNKCPSLRKEIYMITDLARTGWRDVATALSEVDASGMTLIVVPVRPSETNIAVVDVMPRGLPAVGEQWTIAAHVANFGPEPSGEIAATLTVDGIAVARTMLSLAPGEHGEVTLTFAPSERGLHAAEVSLDEDARPNDNRRAFAYELPRITDILVVADDETVRRAVPLALDPDGHGESGFAVRVIGSGSLRSVDLNAYDVAVLADASVDDQMSNRLRTFVSSGGGVIVWTADVDSVALAELFEGTGVRVGSRRGDPISATAVYRLGRVDLTHAVFAPFTETANQRRPPVWEDNVIRALEVSDVARAVAWYEGGSPSVVETTHGSGGLIACSGSLRPDRSDLLYRAPFVPFLVRSVEVLSRGAASTWPGSFVGEPAELPLPTVSGPFTLALPEDNGPTTTTVVFQSGHPHAPVEPSNRAGVIVVSASGRTVAMWPLVVDPGECDPESIDEDEIGALWPGRTVVLPRGSFEEAMTSLNRGFEMWPFLLFGALIVLGAEQWVSHTRRDELEVSEKR
jgi:hypothetical protein